MTKARLVIGKVISWQETPADGQPYQLTGRVIRINKRGTLVTIQLLSVSDQARAGLIGQKIVRKPNQILKPITPAAHAPRQNTVHGILAGLFNTAASRPAAIQSSAKGVFNNAMYKPR